MNAILFSTLPGEWWDTATTHRNCSFICAYEILLLT